MLITKLSAMPYAQARVINHPVRKDLISYTTRVAYIVGDVLVVQGLYSQTTRRHIGAFVREFAGCDYATAKECYTREMGYNIKTRKFCPIPD